MESFIYFIQLTENDVVELNISKDHITSMFQKKCFLFLIWGFYRAVFGVVCPYLEEKESFKEALDTYTLVAITFHYDESRFCYLEKVLECLSSFPKADIAIFTNTRFGPKIARIEKSIKKILPHGVGGGSTSIKSCLFLKHPYELTWCHKGMIRDEFLNESNHYTHFVYLEDDIALDFNNFCYFFHFRKVLKDLGVLPGFLRFEISPSGDEVVSDFIYRYSIDCMYKIPHENLVFFNTENPYMACFILDRELAKEYVDSPSFDNNQSQLLIWSKNLNWPTRERAAMGLTFENIPPYFSSRYVLPVNSATICCPNFCLIHHLPNNYANDPNHPAGKISINSLFYSSRRRSL